MLGCLHTGKHESFRLRIELVGAALFLRQQLLHKLVVRLLQLLVHAGHHTDVVVVDEVDLFKVEAFGQLTSFVSEEEVAYCLGLER